MKPETILDAMAEAYDDYVFMGHVNIKRRRQYRAFRARILRMFEQQQQRIEELEATLAACRVMQPYMPEETLKRMMLLENQNAELKKLHKDCLSVIESQDERIAEQDLLLAQWESIDKLNRERSQQRLQRIAELESVLEFEMNTTRDAIKEKNQRIAQLEAESNRRLELLRRCNEYMARCPFCRRKSTDFHADDCRLAKELSDD